MYKGGLIFGLVGQILLSVIYIVFAIVWPTLNATILNTAALSTSEVNGTETVDTVISVMSIVFAILATITISFATVSILALRNFEQAKRGEKEFNSSLAITAGVLNLLGNILAGILILVGISQAKNEVGYQDRGFRQNNRDSYRRGYRIDDGRDDRVDNRIYSKDEYRDEQRSDRGSRSRR